MDNNLISVTTRPPDVVTQTSLATSTVTIPTVNRSAKSCTVPECRRNNHKWCYRTEKCPMCYKFSKSFYCKTCVGKGDFGHSSTALRGRFYKKQIKFQSIVYSSNSFKNECTNIYSKRQCNILKQTEISLLQEKLKLLKFTILEKNKLLIDKQNQYKKLKLDLYHQKCRVDRYRIRVIRLKDFTITQKDIIHDKTNELFGNKPKLKNMIRTRIKELVIHIFTLSEVGNSTKQNEEILDVNTSLSHALSEASKLTYVCGQWIIGDEWSTKLGYRIVAPILPANGDYSAYNELVSDTNYTLNQTFAELNPAWSINAGLTYTSQLVKLLSFFLDVFLTRRPNFNEFCNNELNTVRFSKYVTHLNANVLYLCFTQNVDPKLLHPDHTLRNLMELLKSSDLGRFDPPDIDSNLCNEFEERINFQLIASDNNSESEEDNYFEWENVPNIEFISDQSQLSLQSTNNVVRSGLVASTAASLAYMWRRGWTK